MRDPSSISDKSFEIGITGKVKLCNLSCKKRYLGMNLAIEISLIGIKVLLTDLQVVTP